MSEIFKKVLTNSGVQITIILGGLAITIINLYIATTLSPIVNHINSVEAQVNELRIEQDADAASSAQMIPEFRVLQSQMADIKDDLHEMRNSQQRMENKIDSVLLNQ